ncbi:MAG: hypothetical protein OJF49_002280 [Ktedonobacterales bacterium]|nr:MAG: hypothetical protein OJF49_002280 [Ktedonobacterales bacterium]
MALVRSCRQRLFIAAHICPSHQDERTSHRRAMTPLFPS